MNERKCDDPLNNTFKRNMTDKEFILYKENLIQSIKRTCYAYITNGVNVTLSNNTTKRFSFKLEDQINLKSLVDYKKDGDIIYYHEMGMPDTLYSYTDIVIIYKSLYNNKVYNTTYVNILHEWIINNYSIDDYYNNVVISYGFTNDYIYNETEVRYNACKLL